METSCDSLAVTSKLPSTKTSLSCVFARAAFVILMVCDRDELLFIVAVPIKNGSVVFKLIIFVQSV
jgi:hypothetical protein